MFIVNKDDKKTIIPFLSRHQEEVRRYLPFPSFFQFKIPPALKDYIKQMDEKYENIYQKEDRGIFINDVTEDMEDNNYVSYIHLDDYWKASPYLDLIYDHLHMKEGYGDTESQVHQNILQILRQTIADTLFSLEHTNYKRHSIKPGKFLQKIFPDATAQECEDFHQKWQTIYKEYGWQAIFETDQVKKYYYHENYAEQIGPLGSSCMRGEEHQNSVQFYQNNNIRLAIYKEPGTDTIRARALVWDVTIPLKEQQKHNIPEKMTFLDRIYFLTEKDKLTMVQYAQKMGYIHKENQSAGRQPLVLPIDENHSEERTVDFLTMYHYLPRPHGGMPYIDTMVGIFSDGSDNYYLTSDIDDVANELPYLDYIYDPVKDRYLQRNKVRSCLHCYAIYNREEEDEVKYHQNKECVK